MTSCFVSLPRAAALSIAITVFASSIAAAQIPAAASPAVAADQTVLLGTPAFARLVKGKTIRVTTADGKVRKGVFTMAETGMIGQPHVVAGRYRAPGVVVPFDQIVKVETAASRHRRMGIGLGIGAVSGLAAVGLPLLSCWGDECEADSSPVLIAGAIGAGIGAAIGAMLDAAHRDEHVIYEAGRRTKSVALTPILSPTRKGVAFSMTWR